MTLSPLRVSADRRRLETTGGTPFFWLGDTAWELPRRLDLEETDFYCRTRAAQGFNLVQVMLISEFDTPGKTEGNVHGQAPLLDWDPTRPNPAYFAHLDAQLEIARAHGLYVALVPVWGDKIGPKNHGHGPELFTPELAHAYGAWLGAHYRATDHLVWLNGGDRTPREARHLETWRALAHGIRAGGARQPMTFHPEGETSSGFWVHAEDWLDFNMVQSGHARRDNPTNHALVSVDTAREPRKPVVNGEPCYEDHPVNWNFENGTFSDLDVRRAAYWSVFSGACGVTYGHYSVFMFHAPPERPGVWPHPDMLHWRDALHRPGATQMRHLRALIEAHPNAEPLDRRDLTSDVRALRDADTVMLYAPNPRTLEPGVDAVRAGCFDPRDGQVHPLSLGSSYAPPDGLEDWVLVLETR
jgi:hypothetical protein